MIALTYEAKADVLRMWEETKAGPRGPGGHGYPDDAIFPLCDALNVLPGVVTMQSCAGHRVPAADGSGECIYPGEVWLWLDAPTFARFVEAAPRLAKLRRIQAVEILFGRYESDSRAIACIRFDGEEVGPEALVESIGRITSFMSVLAMGGGA